MKCGLRPTGHPSRTLARRDGMARIVRHALPIVLILAAAPPAAFAQSAVCLEIRRGESATQAARRVTGDARNTYQASFQIMNASSRFIPKSQYNRIHAGWRACVITPAASDTASNAQGLTASDAPKPQTHQKPSRLPEHVRRLHHSRPSTRSKTGSTARSPPHPTFSARSRSVDLTMVWLGAAMVVPWFGWRILDGHLARRRMTAIVVRDFAVRFVDEFERPLVQNRVAERSVRLRLRTSVRRGRFDILLAPGTGRRYPNLSDHRQNVEYDVARVTRCSPMTSSCAVRSPPTQSGSSCRFNSRPSPHRAFGASAGQGQSGVTCIFSS